MVNDPEVEREPMVDPAETDPLTTREGDDEGLEEAPDETLTEGMPGQRIPRERTLP
jgi:hypothetical protein